MVARFSEPVHAGLGANPTSCTVGIGVFPWGGRGKAAGTHSLPVPLNYEHPDCGTSSTVVRHIIYHIILSCFMLSV